MSFVDVCDIVNQSNQFLTLIHICRRVTPIRKAIGVANRFSTDLKLMYTKSTVGIHALIKR